MRDRDYYPAGAFNDPSAPYNSVDLEPKEFDCIITHTLEKSVGVETDNYRPFRDDDGRIYYETDDVDWVEDYDSQHLDIMELLSELRKLATEKLNTEISVSEKKHLKKIIEESEGWETIEKYVSQE